MKRCRSYRRAWGVFRFSRVRCHLDTGHTGRHYAPGSWIDPIANHRWGREW